MWAKAYSPTNLTRYGLSAYAKYPLLRTVGVDRGFYRTLTVPGLRGTGAGVVSFCGKGTKPDNGRGNTPIDRARWAHEFGLSKRRAGLAGFRRTVLNGLGGRLGALVFQISPLPPSLLLRLPEFTERLHRLLAAIPNMQAQVPDAAIAVEVRKPQWLAADFIAALRDTKATYCMALHAKMAPIVEQLPILRALWPGPLACRWRLHRLHGAFGYENARREYARYNQLVDPDLATRATLARVIAGTVSAGQNLYVTLSNKAEGSAPLSVMALAHAVAGSTSE